MTTNPRSLRVCSRHGGVHYLSEACKGTPSDDTAANQWSVIFLAPECDSHDVLRHPTLDNRNPRLLVRGLTTLNNCPHVALPLGDEFLPGRVPRLTSLNHCPGSKRKRVHRH